MVKRSFKLTQVWKILGELDPGQLCTDRLELALDVVWNVFLRIPEVEMARAALQVNHDDAFGLAPSRTATKLGICRSLFHLKQTWKRKAEHSAATHAQKGPSGRCQIRITQVFCLVTFKRQHGEVSKKE